MKQAIALILVILSWTNCVWAADAFEAATTGTDTITEQLLTIPDQLEDDADLWYFHAPSDLDNPKDKAVVAAQRERLFPLWKSLAEGHDLPKPYGVSLIGNWLGTDYSVSKVTANLDGFPPATITNIDIDIDVDAYVYGVKFDVWLLPFLNFFATLGRGEIEAEVDLTKLPIPGAGKIDLEMDGPYYATGLVVVGGWNRVFVTTDFAYARAERDSGEAGTADDNVETYTLAPRIGYHFDCWEIWIGGRYIDAEERFKGKIGNLNYDVEVDKADWHFLFGTHVTIGEHWEFVLEGGAGDRQSLTLNLGYRF